jgi:hypothetical protein
MGGWYDMAPIWCRMMAEGRRKKEHLIGEVHLLLFLLSFWSRKLCRTWYKFYGGTAKTCIFLLGSVGSRIGIHIKSNLALNNTLGGWYDMATIRCRMMAEGRTKEHSISGPFTSLLTVFPVQKTV